MNNKVRLSIDLSFPIAISVLAAFITYRVKLFAVLISVSIDAALADTEQLLRSTLGYRYLRNTKNGEIKARLLLETTKQYIRRLKNDNMGAVRLADETGFTPEGISSVLYGIKRLNLSVADFQSKSLFGREGKLSSLYGVMLQVQQLKGLKEIAGTGFSHVNLANITSAWVNGESIQDIAEKFFNEKDMTFNLSQAYRTINKQIANLGTVGTICAYKTWCRL